MRQALARVLVLLSLLFAAPAFCDVTETQARLIRQLPPANAVLQNIPPRGDALENQVLQLGVLQEFSQLAQSIAPGRLPRDLEPQVNQYWIAYSELQAAVLRNTKEQDIKRVGASVFRSEKSFYKFRREIFADTLKGELRDYALNWHDSRPEVMATMGTAAPAWLRHLHPDMRAHVERLRTEAPGPWLLLLVAWVILGIALRTAPFHLLANDVWTLQRGRTRLRMNHRVSTVTEVREAVEEVRNVRRPVDQHGNSTGPDQVSVTRYHHMKIFVRTQDKEAVIQLTNQPFNARQGHRLLEVFAAGSGHRLFMHNYDMGIYLPLEKLRLHVKMRPWIFLPVWALATYGTLKFASAFAPLAFFATPVLYLVFMGILNSRRCRRFMREMAPRMVAAAS